MKKQNRRNFVASAVALGASAAAATAMPTMETKAKKLLVHHALFWLKNPDSKEDLAKLLAGLETLRNIKEIQELHVGVLASTEKRDVVDTSYQASEVMFFKNLADQKTYQDHPIHQKFIADCSHLWAKVLVYDSMDV